MAPALASKQKGLTVMPTDRGKLVEEMLAAYWNDNPDIFARMPNVMREFRPRMSAALTVAEAAFARREAEARFAPMGDNHHNAYLCPYCNPQRAQSEAEIRAYEREACAKVCEQMAAAVPVASLEDSDNRAYALAGKEMAFNRAAAAIRARGHE